MLRLPTLLLLIFALSVASFVRADDANESDQASKLVAQLADDDFEAREAATAELLKLGGNAEAALLVGVDSLDREIHYRSMRILAEVRRNEVLRRIDLFLAGKESELKQPLPGWTAYQKQIGDDEASRKLFAKMVLGERAMLASFEENPKLAVRMLADRTADLRSTIFMQRPIDSDNSNQMGSLATMLFLAGQPEIILTPQVQSILNNLCASGVIQQELRNGESKVQVRKMLGSWIRRCEGPAMYQVILLSLQHDLDEALEPATRAFKEPTTPSYILQVACSAFARFGTPADIPIVESIFDHTSARTRVGGLHVNGKAHDAQVRDVALATCVILAGEDPKEFGFPNYRTNSIQVFSTPTVGFTDDTARGAVFAKWQAAREAGKVDVTSKERKTPADESPKEPFNQ